MFRLGYSSWWNHQNLLLIFVWYLKIVVSVVDNLSITQFANCALFYLHCVRILSSILLWSILFVSLLDRIDWIIQSMDSVFAQYVSLSFLSGDSNFNCTQTGDTSSCLNPMSFTLSLYWRVMGSVVHKVCTTQYCVVS